MLQEAHAAYIVGGDSTASIVANLSDKFQALGVLSKEDARVSDVFHVSIATAAALESTSVRAGEKQRWGRGSSCSKALIPASYASLWLPAPQPVRVMLCWGCRKIWDREPISVAAAQTKTGLHSCSSFSICSLTSILMPRRSCLSEASISRACKSARKR